MQSFISGNIYNVEQRIDDEEYKHYFDFANNGLSEMCCVGRLH